MWVKSSLVASGLIIAAFAAIQHRAVHADESTVSADCDPSPKPGYRSQCFVEEVPAGSYLNNVCHLTIHRTFGSSKGSAFVYRGRYLITAGHNIYQQRTRVREIEVRCGKSIIDSTVKPIRIKNDAYFEASRFYHPIPLFRKDYGDDFGVIKLSEPVVGALPIELAGGPTVDGDRVAIAGYPGRKLRRADGTLARAKYLYHQEGVVTSQTSKAGLTYYDIQTYTGNSGGPVFAIDAKGKATSLVAIHVRGNGGGRSVKNIPPNQNSPRELAIEVERLIDLIDGRT